MLILARPFGTSVRLSLDGVELGTIHMVKASDSSIPKMGFDLHKDITVTRSELGSTYSKDFKPTRKK